MLTGIRSRGHEIWAKQDYLIPTGVGPLRGFGYDRCRRKYDRQRAASMVARHPNFPFALLGFMLLIAIVALMPATASASCSSATNGSSVDRGSQYGQALATTLARVAHLDPCSTGGSRSESQASTPFVLPLAVGVLLTVLLSAGSTTCPTIPGQVRFLRAVIPPPDIPPPVPA